MKKRTTLIMAGLIILFSLSEASVRDRKAQEGTVALLKNRLKEK